MTNINTLFRPARPEDGTFFPAMVSQIGTLERNTSYCYLLMARMFAKTCCVVEQDGERVGFLVGFTPPERPDTVFVWQIGVSPEVRASGLATGLLTQVLQQSGASYLEATVGVGNASSRALFTSYSRRIQAHCTVEPCFSSNDFPEEHEEEQLFRIGPIDVTSEQFQGLVHRFSPANFQEVCAL